MEKKNIYSKKMRKLRAELLAKLCKGKTGRKIKNKMIETILKEKN